jgi:hypothetical protein
MSEQKEPAVEVEVSGFDDKGNSFLLTGNLVSMDGDGLHYDIPKKLKLKIQLSQCKTGITSLGEIQLLGAAPTAQHEHSWIDVNAAGQLELERWICRCGQKLVRMTTDDEPVEVQQFA